MKRELFQHLGKRRIILVGCLLLAIALAAGGFFCSRLPRSLDDVTSGRAHLTASLGAGDKFASIQERFDELSRRELVPYDGALPPLASLRFDCLDENGKFLFELSIWDSEEPWIVGVYLDGNSTWYKAQRARE